MERDQCYIIRPMEPGDVATVATIDRLSFSSPWLPSSYFYELNHPRTSFFYTLLKPGAREAPSPPRRNWLQRIREALLPTEEDDRVIGFVGFRLEYPEAHITTIAVHPDWRGRGLGELLLLTALEKALELNVRSVTLEVRASNRIAQHLYRKYGFRYTGVYRGYYRDGEDAWLMELDVQQSACRTRLAALHRALRAQLPFVQLGVRDSMLEVRST
ncbi:MAG: ribosomal protein S18-alanine N-acetyltransferase [Anaerolineae bacterium]|nr:ribosomal protein S18-alanine N-acetyltransferase [Anaerolineae bacterium]